MSSGELLLTLLVALLVFGPQKLPMLAQDLGRLFAKYQKLKSQLSCIQEASQHLHTHEEQALAADKQYALLSEAEEHHNH